ncbi:MAG: 30S ribosomal protein S13 [Saccharolobus sp.]|uniref:Small ribosomal subunit protein uS13 n=2 Tax=Saccharolobus shibatae TaxID=2286 RepID=A0A8F5BSE0_9CREN|nr:30S ribosomal protein S13 [Saccharolobus shibatae]MCH4814282.1 30S ribosomal protein S13 [Saccharolobus shibatae]QXJ27309.1 SSU ribosomal protein S18e (S13p) [Saccharolobus shibatae B12]QXJ30618.1 SSU ribosomal protein S18e (S13p) [Saccharolobus shibatae]QXJ33648.1 SSU ribosomal protein S18e (S13p) [Saccharolobus shibatae]
MSQQFKYVVRIFGQDVDGTMKLPYALAMVKGIGYNTAKAMIRKLGMDPNARLGELSDADIKKVESVISDHTIKGLPSWLYNRRKDYESGLDLHLVTSDLIFYVRNDIEREKKSRSWRGVRHSLGLKVRGQRTRTTGRTGMTIGVARKKAAQPQAQQSSSQQQQKSS